MMKIGFRHTASEDIDAVMAIYRAAREFMRSRGNSQQWINGYPSEKLIREDIANGVSYVGTVDDTIVCVFAFIIGADATYNYIEGKWLNDNPYGTIHRLASSGTVKGVVKSCTDFCMTKVDNIRIDTHECNAPMRRAITQAGYKECGTIFISDGSPRIAYQLTLEMTEEWQKMITGKLYDAANPAIVASLIATREKIHRFNTLPPTDNVVQEELLRSLLGKCGNYLHINPPFRCDFGRNISVGEHFFANFNFTVLDEAPVTIGDNAFIGPNVSIYTACHSTNVEARNARREWAEPVTIGDNVWIGGSVTILPGVTIGSGVTIGAGSVVTKDIPDNVVAAGNPARIIKHLD